MGTHVNGPATNTNTGRKRADSAFPRLATPRRNRFRNRKNVRIYVHVGVNVRCSDRSWAFRKAGATSSTLADSTPAVFLRWVSVPQWFRVVGDRPKKRKSPPSSRGRPRAARGGHRGHCLQSSRSLVYQMGPRDQ